MCTFPPYSLTKKLKSNSYCSSGLKYMRFTKITIFSIKMLLEAIQTMTKSRSNPIQHPLLSAQLHLICYMLHANLALTWRCISFPTPLTELICVSTPLGGSVLYSKGLWANYGGEIPFGFPFFLHISCFMVVQLLFCSVLPSCGSPQALHGVVPE